MERLALARTSNPFTLKLGDNVNSAWDSYLSTTSTDWTKSTVLDTTIVAGQANPKNCRATSGRVEVCNSTYGSTGWLGIASVWASGSHTTQGTVKPNDTPTVPPTEARPSAATTTSGHTARGSTTRDAPACTVGPVVPIGESSRALPYDAAATAAFPRPPSCRSLPCNFAARR